MKNKNTLLAFGLVILVFFVGCKKETEPNCVTWIVGEFWETADGQSLKDYNSKYGYQSAHDISVCGAAKDTIYEDKRVVLRSKNDTAFYVREYIYKKIQN